LLVLHEDGHKLPSTKKDLERMKELTNQMCTDRGLSIAEKGKDFHGNEIGNGEIIAWSKDKYHLLANDNKKSYLASCAIAYVQAVSTASTKENFIALMEEAGWSVIWTDKKKHITFVDAEGHKVRDTNLARTFNLEVSKEYIVNECNGQSRERTETPTAVSSNRGVKAGEQVAEKSKRSIRDRLSEGKKKIEQANREREIPEVKPRRSKRISR